MSSCRDSTEHLLDRLPDEENVHRRFLRMHRLRITEPNPNNDGCENVRADIRCRQSPARFMSSGDKPLVWLADRVRTPPFLQRARIEAGILLRRLQRGDTLSMPVSRPMPGIGAGCHELRIRDDGISWRIVVLIEEDAIVVLDVFRKKSRTTSLRAIERCRRRMVRWQREGRAADE